MENNNNYNKYAEEELQALKKGENPSIPYNSTPCLLYGIFSMIASIMPGVNYVGIILAVLGLKEEKKIKEAFPNVNDGKVIGGKITSIIGLIMGIIFTLAMAIIAIDLIAIMVGLVQTAM